MLGAASTTNRSSSLATNSPDVVLVFTSGVRDQLSREDTDNVLVLEPNKLVGSPSDGGKSTPRCVGASEETSGQGPPACAAEPSVDTIWEMALATATRSSADARRDDMADGTDIRLAARPSSRIACLGTSVSSGEGGDKPGGSMLGVREELWYGDRRGGEGCVAVARAVAMALAMASASGVAGALGVGGRRTGSISSSAATCVRKLK